MTTAPLCFLDTETTGVHPGREVWEVAMIRREGTAQEETHFFVDIDLSVADPFGLSIGKFYERHPYGLYLSGRIPDPFMAVKEDGDFLRPRDAAEAVARWTHGAHIVGAVPNFDTEVLDRLLRKHELIPAWHYHLVDVEALALGWLCGVAHCVADPELMDGDAVQISREKASPPWKSDEISRGLGIEPPSDEERHTALGDARWAMRLYDAVVTGMAVENA